MKRRVNQLIPKILQKCVKEKYNITYYNINKGRGPGKKTGESVVFCPKNLNLILVRKKISLDEQYILGSNSGQLETRTVNALFVEMQHMEQYCCEISEGQ